MDRLARRKGAALAGREADARIGNAKRLSPLGVKSIPVRTLAPATTSGVVADATNGDAVAKAAVAARTLVEVAAATVVVAARTLAAVVGP
jgi:hypothetical protein